MSRRDREADRSQRSFDDLFDWYLIGAIALLTALIIWLPLLTRP